MLIIGYGKLARAIIQRMTAQMDAPMDVYNRTPSVIDQDPACRYIPPDAFHCYRQVLVTLPSQAYEAFFRRFGSEFPADACFFYCATTMMQEEMNTYVKTKQRAVPCKFAGHADILRTMGEGAFAFEDQDKRMQFVRWSNDVFTTVMAKESHVLKANRIATEESLRGLLAAEQRLRREGVPGGIVESVNASIPGGLAQAHKNGTHGHFARDIMTKWQGGDDNG